jgi:hypothetical protein
MNPIVLAMLATMGPAALLSIISKVQQSQKPLLDPRGQAKPTSSAQPTVTPQINNYQPIPSLTPDTKMLLDTPIATDSAKQYLDKIFGSYQAKTPDVPAGWKSPLLGYTQQMAESVYTNKVHPALSALMAIAETQGLRPLASGTSKQNPYNVMNPGTQNLYDYSVNGGLGRAVQRFPENVSTNWKNANISAWRQNPTLEGFVHAYNPTDNPNGEMDVINSLIKQLNL